MTNREKIRQRKRERYANDPEFKRKHLENNKRYRCIRKNDKANKPEVADPSLVKRTWVAVSWGYLGTLQGQVNTEHRAGGN